MSLQFDQKDDLRLRMADLEKKLAESEEERCKLEKTCNVLMRAFREEEKMQYKALNKKYEKFLEDCSVRKRRNDIILRSLCRIEDRSRALFAKTERLKLLKDRYISYLKISDVNKEETYSQSRRTFPLPSEKITYEAGPKLVQWKTPLATHWETDRFRETGKDLFLRSKSPRMSSGDLLARVTDRKFPTFEQEKSEAHEGRKTREINVYNGISNVGESVTSSSTRGELNPTKFRFDLYDRQANFLPKQIESEKLTRNEVKPEYRISDKYESNKREEIREKEVADHLESIEKTERAPPVEGDTGWRKSDEGHDSYDRKTVEDGGQSGKSPVTTQSKSNAARYPRFNYDTVTPIPNTTTYTEENQSENQESDTKSDTQGDHEEGPYSPGIDSKPLPKGLDGVDYQNETYPESYYEQPVHHHNHTSIASDVILEEDETEHELDEEVKDFTPDHSYREAEPNGFKTGDESTHEASDEPQRESETNKESDKGLVVNGQPSDEVKSQQSHSEKSSEGKQSDKSEKSERPLTDGSDKNKKMAKSNLFHLLESDSESFQIEHGDVVSGNEDSDFDFSFNQN